MEAAGSERISESLTWQAACRSDARVGELLLGGEEPDGIYVRMSTPDPRTTPDALAAA